MPGNNIRIKKNPSLIKTAVVSIFFSTIIMLIGSVIIATMLDKEQLKETHIGYGVIVLLIISTWAGVKLAGGNAPEQKLLLSLITGTGYFVLLLIITVLFFHGRFSGMIETGLLILCGSFLGIMPGFKKNKPGKGIKRKKSYR